MHVENQMIAEIEPKMASALQLTDTDEAFRLKSCQRIQYMRKELSRLAELEDTRRLCKCLSRRRR